MRTGDNSVAVAPQTHPQHHRTPLLAGSYERPIRHLRDQGTCPRVQRSPHVALRPGPYQWPKVQDQDTCCHPVGGRNTRISCPAYPRRRHRLSVLHRLKVAVSVVLLDLKTAAANGFCSAALQKTTRWNLIQFGSTVQPSPPFLCTNRPCQAQASGTPLPAHAPWKWIWTSAEFTSAGVQWTAVERCARCRPRLARGMHIPCCRSGSSPLGGWDSPHPTDLQRGWHGGRCRRPRPW